MFEKIISLENLFIAWKEFKRGKMQKSDVQEFALNLEDNLFQLHNDLVSRTYCHSEYTSFYVTDPKLRHIHKARVRDRVLHHAIFRILYPMFDKSFIHDSYSCRIAKGTHRAVNRLKQFLNKVGGNNSKNIYVLKCDVKKFFDSVDHSVLMNLIRKKIYDSNTLWLIENIINSFNFETSKGLPIGNVTSQLFANIYLNELDQFSKHILKARYYIRYCDDFVVVEYCDDKTIDQIQSFLYYKLKLSLHPDKIIVRKYRQGIDFLGYVLLPYHRILRTKKKENIEKSSVCQLSISPIIFGSFAALQWV